MNQIVAKPFFDPGSEALRFLPECPRVLPGDKLGWIAIQHGADAHTGSFNLLDLATLENQNFPLPGRPGFFVETGQPDVLLLGLERRLAYLDLRTGATRDIVDVTRDERVIVNDGLAVPGGVIFGTKHLEFNQPVAALYFFDGAAVHTMVDGQYCSNGKFLRGDTLIDVDSIPRTITRYRLNAKYEVLERSLVVAPESLPAIPDGLRPAPDGESVIVAFYNPAEVADGVAQQIRLSDGAVLCEWIVPGSPRVTCPELVTMDGELKVLFTTATEGMPESTRRIAGGSGSLYIAATLGACPTSYQTSTRT